MRINVYKEQAQSVEALRQEIQTAWAQRAISLDATLSEEEDAGTRQTLLNEAAKETLVEMPDDLQESARLRFIALSNAIRSETLTPLYDAYI